MNKKLFSAMSRRRISSPEIVQHLWDAVKVIRCQRQVPNIDRITRYMVRVHNISEDEVARQLNYCVRDNLLMITKKVNNKGAKVGLEQEGYKIPTEKVDIDGHDWYCLECHSGGDVISCNTCHRVYHLSCIAKDDLPDDDVKHKFICTVCKSIQTATVEPPNIKRSTLNRLLRYTCLRLKERLPVPITERHILTNPTNSFSDRAPSINPLRRPSTEVSNSSKWVLDEDNKWRIESLIFMPMDLQNMKNKASQRQYQCLEEFRADAQTLVHNVVIYHGVHSSIADMARQMLRDCDYDLKEIRQCFHCYRVSNEKVSKFWFCKPCVPPHELVYAKQKGFPYWPAKVIKNNGDFYDVRFFGSPHERAIIEKSHIRPISVNIHTLQVKRTSSWNKACEELKRHQHLLEKLRQETNNFSRPLTDSSSDSEDEVYTPKKLNNSVPPVAPIKFEKPIAPVTPDDKSESMDSSSSSETVESLFEPVKPTVQTKKEVPEPKKRRPGRPPLDKSNGGLSKSSKVSAEKLKTDGMKKKRGRPKKSVEKELVFSETSTASSATNRSSSSNENVPVQEDDVEPIEEKPSAKNIDVPPSSRSHLEELKAEEEEMVSSSCQGVESPPVVQTKSVGVQTKPFDKKPSKDWINKMRLEFEMEEKRTIEKLENQHREEIVLLREKHALAIADVKKKQWCFNCEMEAIYHCCWNTSYCSTECQQVHWQREHKRVCRRKR